MLYIEERQRRRKGNLRFGFGFEEKDYPVTTNRTLTVTNANLNHVITSEMANLRSACLDTEKLEGTGWYLYDIEDIHLSVYQTKPLRAASYIPTPEKFNNPKCGLINIQNEDDERFRWCIKYHQSPKTKHSHRITSLAKVKDKYNYDLIEYPVTYDDIYNFERKNETCIYVYSIHQNAVVLEKEGLAEYIQNDLIYLLRIEDENGSKSHYIYIKKYCSFS